MSDASSGASPLAVLLVDDEAPARRRLRRLLDAMPDAQVIGECASGQEAVARLADATVPRPDVVLLDIQMPGLDGFGVIEAVGVDAMPPVVFQTAFDEHALRAFEVRALDYLVKPVAPERLAEALARVRARAAQPEADAAGTQARIASLVAERNAALRRLLVHDERGGAQLLPLDTVWLARAERNYVVLHGTRGVHRVRGTLGRLAERLDPEQFVQMNRSDVVRLDAIRSMQPWSHGDWRVELPDGTALLWSRRYRARQEGRFSLE